MEPAGRKPNRLKSYDYTQNGTYFITICVQNRKPILSRILAETICADEQYPPVFPCPPRVELSNIGRIVESAIQAIPIHYPDVTVENHVIMPNHVHLLLTIARRNPDTGIAGEQCSPLRYRSGSGQEPAVPVLSSQLQAGNDHTVYNRIAGEQCSPLRSHRNCGQETAVPAVSEIIRQLKGHITKQCGTGFWQRSYHDHIVRNENDYRTIWRYIDENPARWREDKFYTE